MLKIPPHQVAGHQAGNGKLGPLVDESGRFYKPLQDDERGSNEVKFYESFSSSTTIPEHISKFFPIFYGTQLIEASDGSGLKSHLVLHDHVLGRVNPSIVDIKIGSRTWAPQSTEEYMQKCLEKDRETSSLPLGFRLSGIQIYGNKESGYWKPERTSIQNLSAEEVKLILKNILNDKVLYSWGGHNKDITRKVMLISSCISESLDSATKKALMDAADNCVSVEFIFLEQNSSHLADTPGSINKFLKQIGDLENCSFQNYIPDAHALSGLVKKWFQELKEDLEEQLQARFVFKSNLLGSINQISCNLCTSFNQIINEFVPCKSCRCHGIPFDNSKMIQTDKSSCPVTGVELGELDLVESSVKIGEQTILYMPSFQCCRDLQKVPLPINFDVIERTNLRSLDEVVQVLCGVLHSLDQRLVCSSKCNVETAKQTSFLCYYILLPSAKGVMILRRLAGSEEALPVPDISNIACTPVAEDIESSLQASLLKIELRNYDPVQHERGFHQRLNLLVKESLQYRAIPAKAKEPVTASNIALQDPMIEDLSDQANNLLVIEDNVLHSKTTDGKIGIRITEEWEQLVVLEIPKMSSPTCISKPELDKEVSSPPKTTGKLDEKTSRILERLEVPKQLQRKAASPTVSSSSVQKPLIPFGRGITDAKAIVSSQPIKPNFQRLKRKR